MYSFNSVQLLNTSNNYINNYFIKKEWLNYYHRKYSKLTNKEQLYFVSIQPNKTIWTKQDATIYVQNLLPPNTPFFMVLEQNIEDKYNKSTLTDLLHMHVLITESHLKHFEDIILYKSSYDLAKKKKAAKTKAFHIVGRDVYSDNWIEYLLKQTANPLLPLAVSFCQPRNLIKASSVLQSIILPTIYLKKKQTPNMETTHIYTLSQMMRFGSTYDQIISINKMDKQAKQRSNALLSNNFVIIFLKKKKTNQLKSVNHLNKYLPYLPNAPNGLNHDY